MTDQKTEEKREDFRENPLFKQYMTAIKGGKQDGLRCEMGDDRASLYIYDIIDPYYGVSSLAVKEKLTEIGSGKPIDMFFNSPGGDAWESFAIYSMLKRHGGEIVAYIDSIAASGATIIAMAADKVVMQRGAQFMIHKAWTLVIGNENDMRSAAEDCAKMDANMVDLYVAKTGMDKKKCLELMDEETFMNADEAKKHGFADEIIEPKAEDDKEMSARASDRKRMMHRLVTVLAENDSKTDKVD